MRIFRMLRDCWMWKSKHILISYKYCYNQPEDPKLPISYNDELIAKTNNDELRASLLSLFKIRNLEMPVALVDLLVDFVFKQSQPLEPNEKPKSKHRTYYGQDGIDDNPINLHLANLQATHRVVFGRP